MNFNRVKLSNRQLLLIYLINELDCHTYRALHTVILDNSPISDLFSADKDIASSDSSYRSNIKVRLKSDLFYLELNRIIEVSKKDNHNYIDISSSDMIVTKYNWVLSQEGSIVFSALVNGKLTDLDVSIYLNLRNSSGKFTLDEFKNEFNYDSDVLSVALCRFKYVLGCDISLDSSYKIIFNLPI